MIAVFLGLVARRIAARPEDRKDGEIAEGAGELGFFPPRVKWPLCCRLTSGAVRPRPGLRLVAVDPRRRHGAVALTGWVYEFYRGDYAH